ncbi:MAG: hypothetical protein ACTS7E_04945 [Arsenophonus sp. NC-CH8-MAG3]
MTPSALTAVIKCQQFFLLFLQLLSLLQDTLKTFQTKYQGVISGITDLCWQKISSSLPLFQLHPFVQ